MTPPTDGDLLRATSAELSNFLGVWPTSNNSVEHRLLIQGRAPNGQPCMTIGSYGLDQAELVQAVMRAFQVGLVMGAQRSAEVLALDAKYERQRPT